MTVEEAIQKANEGDLSCMVQLGNYYGDCYSNNNDEQSLVEAVKWFGQAASKGNVYSMFSGMLLSNALAFTHQTKGAWNDSILVWLKTDLFATLYLRYISQLESPDSDQLKRAAEAKATSENATYGCALGMYMLDRYDEVVKKLKKVTPERDTLIYEKSQILLGASLKSIGDRASLREAFDVLSACVDVGSAYCPDVNEAVEEILFAYAAIDLGILYLLGEVVTKDDNHAYNIGLSALKKVSDSDARAALNDYLSKFQKKLFGGYVWR